MSIEIKSITILKETEHSGEAHVKLEDENGNTLFLNKLIIDLQNCADVITTVKYKGTNVYGGKIVDGVKEIIQDVFANNLGKLEAGLYKIGLDDDGEVLVEKLN